MFGWDSKGCAAALLALGLTAGCASDPAAGDSREGDGTSSGNMQMNQPSTGGGSGSGASGNKPSTPGGSAGSTMSSSGNAGSTPSSQGGSGMSTGSGGSGSSMMSGGSVDCTKLPLPSNADDVVSTFEDGTGNVNQGAGRGGGFYMFNDGTGMQMPPTGG